MSSVNIGKSSPTDKYEKDEADRLVFLDPHYVNPQINLSQVNQKQEAYYHCKFPARSIHMS